MMKRGYEGVYRKISFKHLHSYLNEFAGRHNIRRFDTLGQIVDLERSFEGKRMIYKQFVPDYQAAMGLV